jgi:NNP family nitrate/nitrite transporter-like MFS transporter
LFLHAFKTDQVILQHASGEYVVSDRADANRALFLSTFAFSMCFSAWLIYGVLLTWLTGNQVFQFDKGQVGWLIGVPVLTGAILRLPVGILTDRYGGRAVMTCLMLFSAVPMFLVSFVTSYQGFVIAGLGFGVTGASFASGVAYVSMWFSKERIGTALGIFGMGNAGAALTSICGPPLLSWLTDDGSNLEGWRNFPRLYAGLLVVTAIVFYLLVKDHRSETGVGMPLSRRLAPLKSMRVWRFGLYYFLLFGGFVSLAQWLIPYYVNVYQTSIATAGLLAAVFSLPSSVIRALGGWMSDRWGARSVMYWVFGTTALCCVLLIVPRMTIHSPGQGVMASMEGTVTAVSEDSIIVGETAYPLTRPLDESLDEDDSAFLFLPRMASWHELQVEEGQTVKRRQLLARGVTRIYFQANIRVFTFLVFIVGVVMGIGMAAVYKHIPVYFPDSVGVTGGMVGVIGGLGGVVCPIIFGSLLEWTGLWTTCWMFLAAFSAGCLIWMHVVIQKMLAERAPELAQKFEN